MADAEGFAKVDFGQLERVAAGDGALVLEVLGLFEGQAPAWAAELQLAAGAPAWRAAAHSLKGSALAIGAEALAAACETAEEGAAEPPGARQPLGERVHAALMAALAEIAAYKRARAG